MSLVIAVALALDGGRDATAFRVVCPFNVIVTCVAGFSRELWWFCMCFCIVLVLAAVYGIVFLQCLHIVFVLSVTLSPFLISTGKPKCCHTNYLNVAGGSSILISPSRWHHNSRRDNFSPRREISSRFNLARSRNTRSRHTPIIHITTLYNYFVEKSLLSVLLYLLIRAVLSMKLLYHYIHYLSRKHKNGLNILFILL